MHSECCIGIDLTNELRLQICCIFFPLFLPSRYQCIPMNYIYTVTFVVASLRHCVSQNWRLPFLYALRCYPLIRSKEHVFISEWKWFSVSMILWLSLAHCNSKACGRKLCMNSRTNIYVTTDRGYFFVIGPQYCLLFVCDKFDPLEV